MKNNRETHTENNSKNIGKNGRRIHVGRAGTRARRKGSVILMVAAALVALCGFCALAIDYGRSVLTKNQLQRACDAGALAGVKYLPSQPEAARTAAVYYAFQNGGVVIDPLAIQITNGNVRIQVPATQRVNYFFGPVIRHIAGDVSARATAAIQQRNNFMPPSIVPIGVTPSTYEAYKDGTPITIGGIRQNKEDLDIREFVLFDLRSENNSKSSSHMQGQLQWGSSFGEVTFIDGSETTLNAADPAQAKHFEDGLKTRFDAASGAPWNDDGTKFTNIPPGSPRVMYFIVTPEQQPVNGNNAARVVGFVPVYVESMQVGQDTMRMRVRFLPIDTGGGGGYSDVSGTDPDAAPLRLERLVD